MKTYFEEISSHSDGESSRPPVIFLHGILFGRKVWYKVAPAIAKKTGRKAYLLDARNHGRSPWSDEMNFDVLTADLAEFMDGQDIGRAVLVGNSMGGRTAINFALKYPDRVDALVVEDMTPRNVASGNHTVVQNVVDLVLQLIAGYPPDMELEEAGRCILNDVLDLLHPVLLDKAKFLKHVDVEMLPLVKEGNTVKPEANLEATLAMMKSNSLVQDLPKKNLVFDGDALFIHGSKGFFNLGKDRTIKTMFPRAVVRRVEGASHFVHMDSPQEYAEIVSDFILRRDRHTSKY